MPYALMILSKVYYKSYNGLTMKSTFNIITGNSFNRLENQMKLMGLGHCKKCYFI
jgi:hypothetical protein